MNIVYGGSFNPPTIAHLEIIRTIEKNFKPNNIIIMPVGTNYYHKNSLASNLDRLNMLNLLFSSIPNVIISSLEMENLYQGTYHTLKELKKEYNDLFFVLGADNLLELDKWINYEKLLAEFNFLVFNRDGLDLKTVIKTKYPDYLDHFIITEMHMKVSASSVRDNLEHNKTMVTEEVYGYIKSHHLYERI